MKVFRDKLWNRRKEKGRKKTVFFANKKQTPIKSGVALCDV